MQCEYNALIKFPQGIFIPSVNTLYTPRHAGNRTWMQKDNDVREFQTILEELMLESELSKIKEVSDNVTYQEVEMKFNIVKNFNKKDLTNFIKIIEDSLANATGVNDNKTMKFLASKSITTEDYESMFISVLLFFD